MAELVTLIKREWVGGVRTDTSREVFCRLASIGLREFYQASAVGFHPEGKFILADYLDYNGETIAEHQGTRYRIIRTYRTGTELELVFEKAPAEEVGA